MLKDKQINVNKDGELSQPKASYILNQHNTVKNQKYISIHIESLSIWNLKKTVK